jgi:PIN domain nuclease of toxin-antitoxin system
MRLLLDTHTLRWWFTAAPRPSVRAPAAIADEANAIDVSSMASAARCASTASLDSPFNVPQD